MRHLVLLALFVLGAVAGMAATPLLSDGAQQQVADFQQEVRYATGRDERPEPPATPTAPPSFVPTPTVPPSFIATPAAPPSLIATPAAPPSLIATPVAPPSLIATPAAPPSFIATPVAPPSLIATPVAPPPFMPTSTPRPTPTPTPRSGVSNDELDSLRYLALRLVNRDRADHGLPPVVLGTNPAAQLHAEDMLEHNYQGHWWVDGRKPYMVYAQTGGTSYAAENAASSGWTDREWNAARCDSISVRCVVPSPTAAITELQRLMMYDDAHANWGHRDNILRESHRAVNIGVASNGRRTTFIQHFEGGAVEAVGPPLLNANGVLSLSLAKRETGIAIGGLASIAYDPPPMPKTPSQIDALDSYCLGGGFTTSCGDPVARVLSPPGPGRYYSSLDSNEVIADSWNETADAFSFSANVGRLMQRPGVYTVVVWRDSSSGSLSEGLVELSLFVE